MSRPPAGIGEGSGDVRWISCTYGGFQPPLRFPSEGRTADQQDAFATAEWLRRADANGSLAQFLMPELEPRERKTAEIEGWILGVA
jgi:hypothetical protein